MTENTFKSAGERIFKLRDSLELTQKDFAESIGVSQSSVNYWENGKREPKMSHLCKISSVYNVPISVLTGTPAPKRDNGDNADLELLIDEKTLELSLKLKPEFEALYSSFKNLNEKGREKAIDYVSDLAQMPKYQQDPDSDK